MRCVIFDLDGTLIDSAPDIAISLNKMLQQMNYPTRDLAQVRNWIGNGAARLIKRALTGQMDGEPGDELYNQAHQLFVEIYDEHLCVESTIYEGVLEGLNALREQNISMACVTNKPRRFTPALLRAKNLDHYFDQVICGDDLPIKKPDPLVLHHVLKEYNFQPSQAVMVGDSASDIQAAKAANIKVFCVSYGYFQGYDQAHGMGIGVDALGADYIIDSVAELPHYLQNID